MQVRRDDRSKFDAFWQQPSSAELVPVADALELVQQRASNAAGGGSSSESLQLFIVSKEPPATKKAPPKPQPSGAKPAGQLAPRGKFVSTSGGGGGGGGGGGASSTRSTESPSVTGTGFSINGRALT